MGRASRAWVPRQSVRHWTPAGRASREAGAVRAGSMEAIKGKRGLAQTEELGKELQNAQEAAWV